MSERDPLRAAQDLMRRLPPQRTAANRALLLASLPDLAEDLSTQLDMPLQVAIDASSEGAGREYLCCDYNREGDSYRSHWSNAYYPPFATADGYEGELPSREMRALEIKANQAFDTYRQLYFEGGLSSVYMWENPPVGFAGVVLLRKDVSTGSADPIAKQEGVEAGVLPIAGTWDSIHIFTVTPEAAGGKAFRYHIDSNIMLRMAKGQSSDPNAAADPNLKDDEETPIPPGLGRVWLGGNLSKSVDEEHQAADPAAHIVNLGQMVEAQENLIRSQVQDIYFGKTRDVVGKLRSQANLEEARAQDEVRRELMARVLLRKPAQA